MNMLGMPDLALVWCLETFVLEEAYKENIETSRISNPRQLLTH